MRPAVFQTMDPRQDVWSEHLKELLSSLDIPCGTLTDNLVASLAMYCRKFHPQGVQSADLKLLVARAFCAVGDQAAAEHVLLSMQPHGRHVSRWLEILSELHHFPELLPYFSHGILRPADWAGAQQDRMWILDFGRLHLSDSEKHEMVLYRSVRAIIEKIVVFWDATRGEGILGLKALEALNVDVGKKQSLTKTTDLLEYIAALFVQQKTGREWSTVPSLLNLDL
jgi:hypothetical protein